MRRTEKRGGADAVAVRTWEEAYVKMCEHGFGVVNHFKDLLHPASQPDAEQRDYILGYTLYTHVSHIGHPYYPL